jgi:hypothetical protein
MEFGVVAYRATGVTASESGTDRGRRAVRHGGLGDAARGASGGPSLHARRIAAAVCARGVGSDLPTAGTPE